MNPIKTQGNFLAYGPEGERIAAFALEKDRVLFEAAPRLEALLQAIQGNRGNRVYPVILRAWADCFDCEHYCISTISHWLRGVADALSEIKQAHFVPGQVLTAEPAVHRLATAARQVCDIYDVDLDVQEAGGEPLETAMELLLDAVTAAEGGDKICQRKR